MTKSEAIKVLEKYKRYAEGILTDEVLDSIAFDMAIESLQTEQKWIPVSERLPEQSNDYICTIPLDGKETFVKVLTFHKGSFYEDDDEWGATFYHDVIAWMPLPKPYREDGEE